MDFDGFWWLEGNCKMMTGDDIFGVLLLHTRLCCVLRLLFGVHRSRHDIARDVLLLIEQECFDLSCAEIIFVSDPLGHCRIRG